MQGKTIADAKGDIFRGIEVVEFACGVAPMTMGETIENVSRGMDTYSYRSCAAEISAVILCCIVGGDERGNSERRMGGVWGCVCWVSAWTCFLSALGFVFTIFVATVPVLSSTRCCACLRVCVCVCECVHLACARARARVLPAPACISYA